ncbi:MAG TPA: sigma factor, partial [Urbifossiella sp.]|nr:sigma factor [Urbifossiella sp.]
MPDELSPAAPTRAEREKMLADVDKLIWSLVRRGGLPTEEDVEDAVQEGRMLAWELTLKFDPTRGVKWSTYFHTAAARLLGKQAGTVKCKATLQLPDDWDAAAEVASPAEDEPAAPDTEVQLFDAVQRQLVGGLLDALAPNPAKGNTALRQAAALPERDLVEAVAFGGMTCAGMAIQFGQEPKVVRTRL